MTDNEAVDTTVDPAEHTKGVDADQDQTGADYVKVLINRAEQLYQLFEADDFWNRQPV